MARPHSRIKALEEDLHEDLRRPASRSARGRSSDASPSRRAARNTLAPPEEVTEIRRQRRRRHYVVVSPQRRSQTRSLLRENLIMLLLLGLSLVGTYKLCIYILNL